MAARAGLSADEPDPNGRRRTNDAHALSENLFSGRTPPNPRDAEDFDEARIADYSIAKDAIYLTFAWSVAEDALRAVLDAASEARVGFWNVSASDVQPIRLQRQIKDLRDLLGDVPTMELTKAALFKMLATSGWTVRRHADDGSRSATLEDGDVVFQVYPDLRRSSRGMAIDWRDNASPKPYIAAISEIQGDALAFFPVTVASGSRQEGVEVTLSDAKGELDQIVRRLRQRDLQAEMREVAQLPLSTAVTPRSASSARKHAWASFSSCATSGTACGTAIAKLRQICPAGPLV